MTGMVEKVYAEAMFQLGVEKDNLDLFHEELSELKTVFVQNPELTKLLSAPTVDYSEKISVIDKIFKSRLCDDVFSFVKVLTEKKRISYLSAVADKFNENYNSYNNIIEITVTTVKPLKEELRIKLKNKIETITGKKIKLIEKTDESIIGGIVLNYGNTMLDSSLKSQLDSLRIRMKSMIA